MQCLPSESAGSLDCPRGGLRTGVEMQRSLVDDDTGHFINSHIRKQERKREEIICSAEIICILHVLILLAPDRQK